MVARRRVSGARPGPAPPTCRQRHPRSAPSRRFERRRLDQEVAHRRPEDSARRSPATPEPGARRRRTRRVQAERERKGAASQWSGGYRGSVGAGECSCRWGYLRRGFLDVACLFGWKQRSSPPASTKKSLTVGWQLVHLELGQEGIANTNNATSRRLVESRPLLRTAQPRPLGDTKIEALSGLVDPVKTPAHGRSGRGGRRKGATREVHP
jgi:hypothetical protein